MSRWYKSNLLLVGISYLPIWSAMLSSLLCQLGVDFPLPPRSDWVFCLSMEAGDLRLTPNLRRIPPKAKMTSGTAPRRGRQAQGDETNANAGTTSLAYMQKLARSCVCSGAETVCVAVNTHHSVRERDVCSVHTL